MRSHAHTLRSIFSATPVCCAPSVSLAFCSNPIHIVSH